MLTTTARICALICTLLGVGPLSAFGIQGPTASPERLEIDHQPPPCLDTEAFPLFTARSASAEAARFTRGLSVRFKAETESDYYEIAFLEPDGAEFRAVLPKPLPEASRVTYYLVAGNPERRSDEHLVNVLAGGCPGALAAPASLTSDLRVRRTSDTQSAIPPLFAPDGIHSPEGLSGTTIGLVAAAAGGAAVAGIALSRDEPAAPIVPTPPTNPPLLRACFTPDPIPNIDSGSTILFDAGCTMPSTVTSYTWDFGDGAAGAGSSVEHLFSPGGTYSVSLTVSDGQRSDTTSRLIRVLATPSACFVTSPDPPRIPATESIQFNAECSLGDRDGGTSAITRYLWDFGDGRPGTEGVFVSRQFEPDVYGVTLTVTNADGRQASKTQFVVVENAAATGRSQDQRQREVTFTSQLEVPGESGTLAARVTLDGSRMVVVANGVPREMSMGVDGSDHVIEARLTKESSRPGRLSFDFNASAALKSGSLIVESGEVLSVSDRRIVFRLSGASAPVLRFRFQSAP